MEFRVIQKTDEETKTSFMEVVVDSTGNFHVQLYGILERAEFLALIDNIDKGVVEMDLTKKEAL